MPLEKQRETELVALCSEMIRAKSYSGQEAAVVDIMRRYSQKPQFANVVVDRYGNCICHVAGGRPGPKVLFDGHMDTVPVPQPEVWRHDPFGATIEGGRMYGRGTSDMKGALAAMLAAANWYAADHPAGFAGDIYVAGVVHEECFEGVAAREVSRAVRPNYVVIGEATGLNLKIGQRGRAEITVETFGVPAHSASPHEGVNAVSKMVQVVRRLEQLPVPAHPVLGEGILVLTDIRSEPYPAASVLPHYCRATFDRRLLAGETKQSVMRPIAQLLHSMQAEDPQLSARATYATAAAPCHTGEEICGERFFPAWLIDRDDAGEFAFVQTILERLQTAGFAPAIGNYNFCTNGSHYAGEAGIPTVGLGPSDETLAHTVDEYIEITQLTGAAECYYYIMEALLKE